ncbi:Spore germination protein B3 precursor [Solibacillus isronensis B3W22]|uniref:Spore germination protein B3 n=1 Tax=Solibacillus isronensis B3W22 TaxID=1224748 RepID=K1L2H4_9BACL|nr:Ger(x)C family spore germination protein [Solibacillus isronensis]AMO85251.1 spore gernimation protein GerC [Solibacillus silvestris]EKB44828.1 Spore germination protein B3 precursor [Solibacillus isronensis B3W22]
MKKYMFILIILNFILTGCWDKRELNELAITLALGIDKVEGEDEYEVTAQVVVPSAVSMKDGTGGTAVTLFTENGETVYEALRRMTKVSPRKIYPGHLQMLIIGEELAKEGIGESLDLLARDWELRPDFYVVVAKDVTAREILNVTTDLESIPASKMFAGLKVSEKAWAGTYGVTLDELIVDLISEGKEAVLTGIQLAGNKQIGSTQQNIESISKPAQIKYDNLAVFKEDRLMGWLTEQDSRGYSGITNSVKSTVTSISCPNEGKSTIEVTNFHSKIEGNIVHGKPEVNIHTKAEGNVGEVRCKIDLKNPESIQELEKIYEKEATRIINETIDVLQEKYQSDIFGFGEAIHRSNPEEWNKIKENWDEEFSDLTVNVKVDMKIRLTGTVNSSFLEKIKN